MRYINTAKVLATIIAVTFVITLFSNNVISVNASIGPPIPLPTIPHSSQVPPFLASPPSNSASSSYNPVVIDNMGIPYVDYGTIHGIYIGLQRNPVTVAIKAFDYYNEYRKTGSDIAKKFFINMLIG